MEENWLADIYRSRSASRGDKGRFVAGPEALRFWSKVARADGCWLWLDGLNRWGYGRFRTRDGRLVMAHRYAYELVTPIPDGMTLDHLCVTPACVRPSHLEPVTNSENVRRRHERRRLRMGAA